MDLCNAICTESLDVIKALVDKEGFFTDSEWLDYKAMNSALKCRRKDVVRFLLQSNCRVNTDWKFPLDTPLHNSVQLADPELVCDLLKRRAFIAVSNTDGNSPLHLAFLRKQEKIVDIMLDFIERNSIFSNPKNNQGLTHLHIACTRNNARAIEGFLDNGALAKDMIINESVLWAGFNAFHFAAEFKSMNAIKVLLRNSSVVGLRAGLKPNSFGKTPLQTINEQLEEPSIMASLMTSRGFSPFHVACVGEDSKLLKSFLDNDVDVNKSLSVEKFCTSYSPLHLATKSANSENTELLLQYGADANCQNQDGMTPVQLSLYSETSVNNSQIVRMLYNATNYKLDQTPDKNGLSFMHAACSMNDLEMVKKFVEKGEDVNSKVTYESQRLFHYTPLHFAIKYGHLDMAQYLIRCGAKVNCGNNCVDGTPLLVACKIGHQASIDFLLESGANVKVVRPYDKKTPLHLLVEGCLNQQLNFDAPLMLCISKLIKLGVEVNAQDGKGDTVLHLACSKVNFSTSCVELLLENGADVNVENNFGRTPFDCQLASFRIKNYVQPGEYTILYHHVQKLKEIGFAVNTKNEACCERLLGQQLFNYNTTALDCSEEELARKRQQRIDEVERMKSFKLTNKVSLYDFLRLELKRAKDFLTPDTWMQVLQEFPLYGYLLKLQYQKAFDCIGVEEKGLNRKRAGNAEFNASHMAAKRPG